MWCTGVHFLQSVARLSGLSWKAGTATEIPLFQKESFSLEFRRQPLTSTGTTCCSPGAQISGLHDTTVAASHRGSAQNDRGTSASTRTRGASSTSQQQTLRLVNKQTAVVRSSLHTKYRYGALKTLAWYGPTLNKRPPKRQTLNLKSGDQQ
jgi:hypothetical protein